MKENWLSETHNGSPAQTAPGTKTLSTSEARNMKGTIAPTPGGGGGGRGRKGSV